MSTEHDSISKKSKWVKILIYLLVVFLFQEITLRIVFPVHELKNLDRSIYTNLNQYNNQEQFVRNQPMHWQSSLDTNAIFVHEMNMYGFRDKEWNIEKPTEQKRVLFIGDSFIEGIMANQDQTIPQGFQKSAGYGYEVMNAGLVGQGLNVYLQLVADLIPAYQPDVTFLCIYANDLGQNEPPVPQYFLEPEYYNLYKPRLFELISQMRSNNPILSRWTGESKPFMDPAPQEGNPWTEHEAELKLRVTDRIAEEMKKATFNPFRTNGLFVEEYYLKLPPKLGETIPFFQYVCQQNGSQPVVVYIPSKNQTTKYYLQYELEMCQVACNESMDLTQDAYQIHRSILAEECSKFNIQFIDLTPTVVNHESNNQHLYWNYDEHMKGSSYLMLGKEIWNQWLNH